jgi:hypothetical protein
MKRALYFVLSVVMMFSVGLYLHSKQESSEKSKEQPAEPVATIAVTKQLLAKLEDQLTLFQRKNSEQSERLAGVFAKWKQAGKIKQAEQWNQVRSGIDALLSIVQIIRNDFERMQQLRRNKDLFTALRTLQVESQKITPQMGDTRFLMQSASLYGKRIFEDKLLEKLKGETAVAPEKKKSDSSQYDSIDTSFYSDSGSGFDSDLDFNEFDDSPSNEESYDDYDFDFGSDFDFDDSDFYF